MLEDRLTGNLREAVAPVVPGLRDGWGGAALQVAISTAMLGAALINRPSGTALGAQCAYPGDRSQNILYRAAADAPTARRDFLLRLVLRHVVTCIVPPVAREAASWADRAADELDEDRAELAARRARLRLIARLLRLCEAVGRAAGLAHFLVFLYDGRARSWVDRALGLTLATGQARVSRRLHTGLIDQQNFWTTLFSCLSVLVPLFPLARIADGASAVARRLIAPFRGAATAAPAIGTAAPISDGAVRGAVVACPGCGADPAVMPRKALECGHRRFCYCCTAHLPLPAKCDLCGVSVTQFVD
jgi:hypothetical protein